MRRLALTVTSAVALATLAGTSLGSASGQQAAAPGDPYGSVWNILPPGSSGNVTALDLIQVGLGLTASGTTPKNFGDQLEMYDALAKKAPSALTRADVDNVYVLMTYLSMFIGYQFDDSDWLAIEMALPETDAAAPDGSYEFPLVGRPQLVVRLARNVGADPRQCHGDRTDGPRPRGEGRHPARSLVRSG
jgi:hypothetical protein